jgi:gamma-polyglutamate biosynthesis protein CapA
MKLKLTIFAMLAIMFGFGTLWTASNSIKVKDALTSIPDFHNIINFGKQLASTGDIETETNSSAIIPEEISAKINPIIAEKEKANEITVIIGGDIMMDRNVRSLGEKNGYDSLFTEITPLFGNADIVVVNLEGPITSNPSKTLLENNSITGSYTFTFDPKVTTSLAKAHISAVSLANNHTDNFGTKGLDETKHFLSEAGLQWFGNPWNKSPLDTVISKNGGNVALVGYNAFEHGYPDVVERVKELSKKGYFVIVMPHWGNEYSIKPTEMMKGQARELTEAGANAIIGSHSHIIGENEWLGTVPVYYSLGNLLFDQYISPETMKGELVELHLIVENGKTQFDSLKIIEVSNASRKGIEITSN